MKKITKLIGVIYLIGASLGAHMEAAADDQKIKQVENSLGFYVQLKGREAKKLNLLDQMEKYNVPAMSIALIDQGKIAWVKSWGVKNVADQTPVTPKSLFQAGSISKPVAAFAALRLVDRGDMSLRSPINEVLKQWQVPENDLTKQEPVTLARLLSHSAGMTVHGFPGYALDKPIPDIVSVLRGEQPANTKAIEVDTLPGSIWRYSGGGYTVAQVAMEDASGMGFVELMSDLVLKPTGMTESSFQQPLGLDRSRDRVTGYLEELQPVAHQFHAHPEMAAAGLWTNPTDLANFALAVTQAWQGQEGALLSHDMAKDFLTIQKGTWGLGFQLHKKDEKVIGFSHTGGTVGFRSALFMLLDGRGVAIMTNSDTGRGAPVMRSLLSTVSSLYDLPFNRPEQKEHEKCRPKTHSSHGYDRK